MADNISKKVIIRRTAGLGDLLLATAHAWYYADRTGRDLEICWVPSVYLKDKSQNLFGYIYEVPDKIGNVKIIYHDHTGIVRRNTRRLPVFPPKYLFRTLLIETTLKFMRKRIPNFIFKARMKSYRYMVDLIRNGKDVKQRIVTFNSDFNFLEKKEIKPFFDSLKLKEEYRKEVEQFIKQHFKDRFVIGAHVRYYDKDLPVCDYTKYWLEPEKSLEILKDRLEEITSKVNGTGYIVFLATNSDFVNDYIKNHVKNVVTFNKKFAKIKVNWSLHHLLDEESLKNDIIEMYLLAHCNILYRYPANAYSWFSYFGSLYAEEVINE